MLPHVANREYLYEIDYHEDKPDVDYVVFDIRYGVSNSDKIHMANYLENGYEIYQTYEGYITILKKAS